MASTNFKLFDENALNMMSDGDYENSNQRLSGVQTGVASSQLQNKVQHQLTYMAKAIADYIVEKGINVNDTENYANFADKIKSGLIPFSITDELPTASTYGIEGDIKVFSPDGNSFTLYICVGSSGATYNWVPLTNTVSKQTVTQVITEDTNFYVSPLIESDIMVRVFGGGGSTSGTTGGGGGHMEVTTLSLSDVMGLTIPVTIGKGGTYVGGEHNGGATSFGTYVSASGGSYDGTGGTGGGGSNTSAGGNATYGGGGGSGGRASGIAGGNGGTYGGGGGAGGGNAGSASGGLGGIYGGNGGKSGGASVGTALNGSPGTDTRGMGLEFEGQGAGGGHGSTSYGAAGGGGGGYGGNGGSGGAGGSNYGAGGGGGGGYGGNGGAGGSSNQGGGGGGGYGGNGHASNGSTGGGGGGYGPNNYGRGGTTVQGSPTDEEQAGKSGCCVLYFTKWVFE